MVVSSATPVVVAGGGPTGLVAAILLAQRGHHVQVYEKRENPLKQEGKLTPPRTIFWGIGPRGEQALQAAGVPVPQKQAEQLGGMTRAGSMDFMAEGQKPWFGKQGPIKAVQPQLPKHLWAARAELVQHLVKQIQSVHANQIQLAFQHTLTAVDWEQQTAEFQDAAGKPVSAPYSLLVGADGVNSKTRSLYQQHDPSLEVFLQPALKDFVGFSGISVDGYNADPMGSQHPLRDERGLHLKAWRGNSHFWTIMFSANSQGSLTGHLSAKRAIIARVHTAEEYERILETKIPILPACLRQPVAAALEGARKAPLGTFGRVSSLVGPRLVLLGDAAHSVSPALGQGVNCAIQDAQVLSQVLDEADQDIDRALPAYQALRHPEVLALHYMDLASPAWLGQRARWHPVRLAKTFHDTLQKWRARMRGVPESQMPYPAALNGSAPYVKAYAAWKRDRNLFFGLVAAAGALLLSLIAGLLEQDIRTSLATLHRNLRP